MAIVCPDCSKGLDTVVVEISQSRVCRVDYDKQTITPDPAQSWETDGDHVCRCPHCDSLNVDDEFSKFHYQE